MDNSNITTLETIWEEKQQNKTLTEEDQRELRMYLIAAGAFYRKKMHEYPKYPGDNSYEFEQSRKRFTKYWEQLNAFRQRMGV